MRPRKKQEDIDYDAINCLRCDDDEDIDPNAGFSDGNSVIIGTPVASFTFGPSNTSKVHHVATEPTTPPPQPNTKVNTAQPTAETTIPTPTPNTQVNTLTYGALPLINGEPLAIKRCYRLRASTIKKLNTLIGCHPEMNVYVSSIVDKAIDHYYNHIINEGGKQ